MQRLNTFTILTLFILPMLSLWSLELWWRKTRGQKKFLGLEIFLNLFILMFYSLIMWKEYNPFTTESVLVSGLLAVQLFKTIREIVSMFFEIFESAIWHAR